MSPWHTLLILLAVQTLMTASSQFLPPLAPLIRNDLGLTQIQVGAFISFYYIGCAFASVLSGRLTDSAGVRQTLVAGQILAVLGLVLFTCLRDYRLLLAVMVAMGLGYSVINPVSAKIIVGRFPVHLRGLAMGIKQTGVTIGGTLTAALLPSLALNTGWRLSVLAVAGTILLFVLVSFVGITDDRTSEGSNREGASWRMLLKNRWLITLTGFFIVLASTQVCITTYLIMFLNEKMGLNLTIAGWFAALVLVGGTVGRVLWGLISDRFLEGSRISLLVFIAFLASTLTFSLSLIVPGASSWLMFILLWFLGFSATGWNALFLVSLVEQAGQEVAGTAIGICMSLGYIGMIGGPPIFGWIVDKTGSYGLAFQFTALALALTAGLVGAYRFRKWQSERGGKLMPGR